MVDVTPEALTVTYRTIDTFDPDAQAADAARFRVLPGGRPMEVLSVARPRGSAR